MLNLEYLARAVVDSNGDLQAQAIEALRAELQELAQQREAYKEEIEYACASNSDDDISFDAPCDAYVSVADGGVWVSAWVWVPVPDDEAEGE